MWNAMLLQVPCKAKVSNFLSPGTGFVEDNSFLWNGGRDAFGVIQTHYIYGAF